MEEILFIPIAILLVLLPTCLIIAFLGFYRNKYRTMVFSLGIFVFLAFMFFMLVAFRESFKGDF